VSLGKQDRRCLTQRAVIALVVLNFDTKPDSGLVVRLRFVLVITDRQGLRFSKNRCLPMANYSAMMSSTIPAHVRLQNANDLMDTKDFLAGISAIVSVISALIARRAVTRNLRPVLVFVREKSKGVWLLKNVGTGPRWILQLRRKIDKNCHTLGFYDYHH